MESVTGAGVADLSNQMLVLTKDSRKHNLLEILALPGSVIPVACIAVGYPGEVKEPRTRYNRDYVHFERW